jgi:2-dehydro-3-deoxyphosphogluconate aldolase/(4S)-4-hydroxy-2-oxoglutarate aldolase
MTTLSQILEHKIVAILRGIKPKDVLNVATALHAGGIRLLEVTLNSEDALIQIEELAEKMGDKMVVGAGTVLDVEGAEKAIRAGAKFLISPTVDVDVIKVARHNDIVSIPGAYTATEIFLAHKSGADIIKVFPVSSPDYIKSLLGPLNNIKLMPTGGVNVNNILQFHKAGAVAFGIGSSLVPAVTNANDDYYKDLTIRAENFIKALNEKGE